MFFLKKKYNTSEIPIVGWCGNPNALQWFGAKDVKGIKFIKATNLPLDEMPSWYQSVDIYVCASRYEGTPMPVLEAMAVGDTIISTNVGIIQEIKSPGIFLFNGTSAGLISTLYDVLRRRKEWKILGHLNRDIIKKNYSAEISAQKLMFLLRRLNNE